MESFRKYGSPPFRVLVLHGGPGAPGSAAGLAELLSGKRGVIEPFQTGKSIKDQVQELGRVIDLQADLPVALVGHSWGSWLACLYAAGHPGKAGKLILVGSGPFKEEYVPLIEETGNKRFSAAEREELSKLEAFMKLPAVPGHILIMKRYAELMRRAGSYDPVTLADRAVDYQPDIYRLVWEEASALRGSGELLETAGRIDCPVVAVHGMDDPHPVAGVEEPLRGTVRDFRFIGLKNCGHEPWNEKKARRKFLKIMRRELRDY